MSAKIISTKLTSTIFSTNKTNEVEINHDKKVEADSEFREVIKKGYLLNNINLSTVPDVVRDAIDKAIIDAKNQTLADSLIETLKQSLENLDDGVYKKTYIDNMMTYVENLLTSKVNLETVASIADSKLAVALQDYASTTQVELLNSRVGNSESEITNIKETINTKDSARATQIEELEASIEDTFAGYSNAIDLYVDADGNVKSQKIETLSTNIGLQLQELNELIVDKDNEWNAKSIKLITSPTGAITGYSFQNGSGLKSTFEINADNFKIANAYNTYSPFSIVGTSLFFNGKVTFSNITGGENIVTKQNVQDAINNNVTIIDAGKIVTNEVFVNNLNAVGGIIAENISANELVGKTITGGVINGARINGAVIKASYLDLNGDLEVLTNFIISVATRNANPSLYTDAVYISADNQYRIPSLSVVREETRNQTLSSTGATFKSKIRSYNCANAGHNLKCVKIRPSVYIGGVSATINLPFSRSRYAGMLDSSSCQIFLGNYLLGTLYFRNRYSVSSGAADESFSTTYYYIEVYFNSSKIYEYSSYSTSGFLEDRRANSPNLNTTRNVGGVILRIIANSFTSVTFKIEDGSHILVANFTDTSKSLIEIKNSNQTTDSNIVASVNSATYINNMI